MLIPTFPTGLTWYAKLATLPGSEPREWDGSSAMSREENRLAANTALPFGLVHRSPMELKTHILSPLARNVFIFNYKK